MPKPASTIQRRLAAILCADVAGYTRLMNADEAGTLRLLTSHRDVTDRLIPQHGGRIANTAGDSILAEFPSAVDAVQCALGIQERIAVVHEEVPEPSRVRFRIGIHVGEAMVRDGDLFGDGVNIAARMQALAEPGSVCLSATAYEFVEKLLTLPVEDLGPQPVKNLDRPVRAYLTRPSGEPASRELPAVHRQLEFYLARRFQAVCLRAQAEVAEREGIAAIDMPALASIADAPDLDLRRLAERLGISIGRIRHVTERLAQLGLVERRLGTSRRGSQGLRLTSIGLEVCSRLRPAVHAAQDGIMAPLSERERETLRDLLTRVIKADAAKARRDDGEL